MPLLEINDLHASVEGKPILNGVNLAIAAGERQALLGPNGAGKSTLAYALMGKPGVVITKGQVLLDGENLLALPVEERARRGLFLAFQRPPAINGVTLDQLLRSLPNRPSGKSPLLRSASGRSYDEGQAQPFLEKGGAWGVANALGLFGLPAEFAQRALHDGVSGGEQKRLELAQFASLQPRLAILDEVDSGLDVDGLRQVGEGVDQIARQIGSALLVITHYQRLLQHLPVEHVHVMVGGRIAASGGPELASEVEANGYDGYS